MLPPTDIIHHDVFARLEKDPRQHKVCKYYTRQSRDRFVLQPPVYIYSTGTRLEKIKLQSVRIARIKIEVNLPTGDA